MFENIIRKYTMEIPICCSACTMYISVSGKIPHNNGLNHLLLWWLDSAKAVRNASTTMPICMTDWIDGLRKIFKSSKGNSNSIFWMYVYLSTWYLPILEISTYIKFFQSSSLKNPPIFIYLTSPPPPPPTNCTSCIIFKSSRKYDHKTSVSY